MAARVFRRQREILIANAEKVIAEINSATEKGGDRVLFLETKLSGLEGDLKKLNEKICLLITDSDDEEAEQEGVLLASLSEKFADSYAKLKVLTRRPSVSASVVEAQTRSSTVNASAVRLPKLQLKKFSGNELEWQEFIDMFNISVHDTDIPAIQKFVHLKSLLANEAALCLNNIEISEDNYVIAYERLSSRYGNLERQRNRLVNKLVNLPAMDVREISSATDYVDNLVGNVRALEKFGLDQKQYGGVILPVMESKLSVIK